MTLDEILEAVALQSDMFLKPQSKAEFKRRIDLYFKKVSEFKEKLDPHVVKLKKAIDKFKGGGVKSKLLDMDNYPGNDCIINHSDPPNDVPIFDLHSKEGK